MTPEPMPETQDSTSRTDELSALLQVSQTMVSSFDIDRNLRKAMRVLAEGLDLQRATVALVHPETR